MIERWDIAVSAVAPCQCLTPGATVEILHYQPLDDLFEVRVGGRLIRLGSEGLAGLRGELAAS